MAGNRFEKLNRPFLEDGVKDPVAARDRELTVRERVVGVLERRKLKRDAKKELAERRGQGAVPF